MLFGKHVNRYYLIYSWMILLGILALGIVDAAQLKVPELYRMVLNGINDGFVLVDGQQVAFTMDFVLDSVCRPLLVVIILMIIGRCLWRVCLFGVGIKTEQNLRMRMFDHCKDLSQQYYHTNKVGNLMSLFTNDLSTINECFGDGFLMFFDCLLLGGMSVFKMFRMNWKMASFCMIPMIILFICSTLIGRKMSLKWDERQESFSRLSDFSQEIFTGLAVVKAFVKETVELMHFKKLNKANEKINVQFVKLSTIMDVMVTLFVETVICVILGYGGWLVYSGVFNAGDLIEFIGYFSSMVWPVMAVSMLIDMRARGKASLKRISELLDSTVDVVDDPDVDTDPEDFPFLGGKIEFRGLNFTYPLSEREILHDLSFTIEPGENVGIIGRTGSGKTTIVDLLTRTYSVADGTLFIDGKDVNEVPIKAVRERIAYVPQDNFLFSEEISRNISFAFDGEVDAGAISQAALLADVDENINEFPEKYDTVLGERGVTVSGGQKQRISIARALLKNAEILILDDSVSAVDTKTEKKVLENLRSSRQGRTTILIAHRITTVEKMDKILFIDEGRLVDMGTHAELVERCREYADLVKLQRLEEEKANYGKEPAEVPAQA